MLLSERAAFCLSTPREFQLPTAALWASSWKKEDTRNNPLCFHRDSAGYYSEATTTRVQGTMDQGTKAPGTTRWSLQGASISLLIPKRRLAEWMPDGRLAAVISWQFWTGRPGTSETDRIEPFKAFYLTVNVNLMVSTMRVDAIRQFYLTQNPLSPDILLLNVLLTAFTNRFL